VQGALGFYGGLQGIPGMMKCGGERVSHELKHKSVVRPDGLIQDVVMTRQQRREVVWKLLGKPGAAFDICE
jgi:hypothetical protein